MIAALLLAAAMPSAPAAAAVQPAIRVAQADAPAFEVWQVDQVRVAPDTGEAKLKALEPDHSLDAVIAHLKRLGVPFTRAQVGLVPSRMPEKMRGELAGLPDGEPFILPGDEFISINVIIARQLPPDTVRFVPRLIGDAGEMIA